MKKTMLAAVFTAPCLLAGFSAAAVLPAVPAGSRLPQRDRAAPKAAKHKPDLKDGLAQLDKELKAADAALAQDAPKFQDAAVHFEAAWSQAFALNAVMPPAVAKDPKNKQAFNAMVDALAAAAKRGQTAANGRKSDAAKAALADVIRVRDKIAAMAAPKADAKAPSPNNPK